MRRIIKRKFRGKKGGTWFVFECNFCHKEFIKDLSWSNWSPCLFCSRSCSIKYTYQRLGTFSRERNSNWKGGKHKTPQGYIKVLCKNHPHADPRGYVFEHRLIMEKVLGRYLKSDEFVHHINGDKTDNRPENLQLFQRGPHHSIHMQEWYKYFSRDPDTGRFISHN